MALRPSPSRLPRTDACIAATRWSPGASPPPATAASARNDGGGVYQAQLALLFFCEVFYIFSPLPLFFKPLFCFFFLFIFFSQWQSGERCNSLWAREEGVEQCCSAIRAASSGGGVWETWETLSGEHPTGKPWCCIPLLPTQARWSSSPAHQHMQSSSGEASPARILGGWLTLG